jgi:YD repeat-containing protein
MDRRQLLLGATALGLAANFNLNRLLVAQVANTTTGNVRLSDRERAGLRGSIKTCSDFIDTETESMSEREYAADGRLMVWRGRTFNGSVERVYSYDGTGKLISVTSAGSDVTEEFHYDQQGKKTRVRTVPPRPGQEGMATSVEIMFETTEEGEGLNGGGSVTTRYNNDDQPSESLVRDAHGDLLTKIVHNYANGRLVSETLTWEALDLPKEFLEQPSGEQLSGQQQRAIRAHMKALLSQHGLYSMGRSYLYDNEGRVSRMTMQMGNLHLETSTTYNEHGDKAVKVRTQSGSLGESPDSSKRAQPHSERSEVRYSYQYDNHGNWTEKTDKTVDGASSSATHRKLTYY